MDTLNRSTNVKVTRNFDKGELDLTDLVTDTNALTRSVNVKSTSKNQAQSVQKTSQQRVTIPHRYTLSEEYRTRPSQFGQLDWILSTHPTNIQQIRRVPEVEKWRGVPQEDWILDTKSVVEDNVELREQQLSSVQLQSESYPSKTDSVCITQPIVVTTAKKDDYVSSHAGLSMTGEVDIGDELLKTARKPEIMPESAAPSASAATAKKREKPSFLRNDVDLTSSDFISPTSVSSVIPATARQNSMHHIRGYLSDFEQKSNKTASSKTKTISTQTPCRNLRRAGILQSDANLRTAALARSHVRVRLKAKAAFLKERRKKRLMMRYQKVDRNSVVTPTENLIVDDHVIQMGPLRGPISVDSKRILTRSGEQINLRQILRIYGSGAVEEPYEDLPRRSSTKSVRGAVASVRCGTNMVEITLTNTAIQPGRRGQSNNWVFAHARDVHTVPLVFGNTVLVERHPPAPFCLSVAAPFWVSVYQEQIGSGKGGERFRESIEIRSCKDSGAPCYEMSALVQGLNPVFKERVYLGKNVIRIDRSAEIQNEQGREYFPVSVKTTVERQYRVELPWRQMKDRPDLGLPRAPQIGDIHTTVRKEIPANHRRDMARAKKAGKFGGRRVTVFKRRRLHGTARTAHNFGSELPYNMERVKSAKVTSTSGYSTPSVPTSPTELSIRESFIMHSDLPTQKFYLPRSGRMKKCDTPSQSGILSSSRQASAVHLSIDEITGQPIRSDLPRLSSTRDSTVSQNRREDPLILKPPRSKDQNNKTTPETLAPSTESSASTHSHSSSEYRKGLPRARKDKITVAALPPVLLHLRRRFPRKTGNVTDEYKTASRGTACKSRRISKSQKSRSQSSVKPSKPRSFFIDQTELSTAIADMLKNDEDSIQGKLEHEITQLSSVDQGKSEDRKADAARLQQNKITVNETNS